MPAFTRILEDRPAWLARALTRVAPLLVITAALVAYANAWPDALVHDDKFYYDSERFSDFSNIPRYFRENVWASSGISEPLYRPLQMASIAVDARVHGDWVAGYHLTNIALHAVVSVLVFVFVRKVLQLAYGQSGSNTPCALMVALLFAVHPVFAEAVNSVFNRSDILVALGSLCGLLWFLQYLRTNRAMAWLGLGLAYLFVLFCKESGLMLPGLAVVLTLTFAEGDWRSRARSCLPALWLLIPLAIYFVLRARALDPAGFAEVATLPTAASGDGVDGVLTGFQFPDWRRLLGVAQLGYASIRIMVWPSPLMLDHPYLLPPEQVIGAVLFLALLATAAMALKRRHYGPALGLAFFCIALLPASRIIGDPESVPHLAERYLYFPSVGLAIALAFGARALAERWDSLAPASAFALAIILLTPLTWSRNAAWANEVSLYESEIAAGISSSWSLVWLTAAYIKQSEYAKVVDLCDQHAAVRKVSGKLSVHCAVAYSRVGRLDEAERAYLVGTRSDGRIKPMAHANLGRFYLKQDRWQDARTHFELAVEAETLPANRAYRRGYMLIQLYPRDRQKLIEAKGYFQEALELQPDYAPARRWLARVERALTSR